jgi:hypothetical protein
VPGGHFLRHFPVSGFISSFSAHALVAFFAGGGVAFFAGGGVAFFVRADFNAGSFIHLLLLFLIFPSGHGFNVRFLGLGGDACRGGGDCCG